METEKVQVFKFQEFREWADGGTIEYRDMHNRRYFVLPAKQKDTRIFAEYPKPLTGSEAFRQSVALVGIELEILEVKTN